MNRRRVAALVLAGGVVLGACADSQDPGLVDQDNVPSTTSNTLGQCPADGPDATTLPAGCLDADGQVQRP